MSCIYRFRFRFAGRKYTIHLENGYPYEVRLPGGKMVDGLPPELLNCERLQRIMQFHRGWGGLQTDRLGNPVS